MDGYSIRAVALAIEAPTKWLDNLLSHHAVPGVQRSTRGVERRISLNSLAVIAVVRILSQELDIAQARAVELALGLDAATSGTQRIRFSSGISVEVPIDTILARTRARLGDALEATSHIRRGRPRSKPTAHE